MSTVLALTVKRWRLADMRPHPDNLEQIAIFNDEQLAEFHRGWMAELEERNHA